MSLFLRAFLGFLGLALFAAAPARAQFEIDITRGHLDPMPIAIPDFVALTGPEGEAGRQVAELVRANLERSGLFRTIAASAFIERVTDVNAQPRFADWRIINAQALVVGQVSLLQDGRQRIEFRLWDVTGEQQVVGLQYATSPENWRRIAHKISDAIYERLTAERGYFDTRIVFVHESGTRAKPVKRLAIMDQDGANPSFLTDGAYLVLAPRFSPTAQQITYVSFEGDRPRVFLFNIETGRQEVLGQFGGISFASRFSPQGDAIVLSGEQNGNSDIYLMDLRTRQRRQLTNGPAIDTAPSFSPDGAQITFESDRGGSQQIYVMNADGSDQRRISFGDGRYATPVWSPRGDLIAFTRQGGGRFQIGVMRPDGSGERILTDSYMDEGPTWSPNGRVIMFFREDRPGAGPSLWSVDLTGQNLRKVDTPGRASDPAWSPLLP
jgi:TolB protein